MRKTRCRTRFSPTIERTVKSPFCVTIKRRSAKVITPLWRRCAFHCPLFVSKWSLIRLHRNDKLRALKYQRMKLRHTLFTIDPKNKKTHAELKEDESDLDEDWIAQHEDDLAVKDREKVTKKFEKENEKLVAEGEKAQGQKVLDERLAEVDETLDRLKEERTSKQCVFPSCLVRKVDLTGVQSRSETKSDGGQGVGGDQ